MRIMANMANTLAAELLVSANPGKEAVLLGLIPLKVLRLSRYCRDIQSIIFTYYHCVLIQNFQSDYLLKFSKVTICSCFPK